MDNRFRSIQLSSGDVIGTYAENWNYYEKNRNVFQITENLIRQQTIYPRFRIFVLNPDESRRYEIPQEDILTGGSYQENYQNGARRSLSFQLYNETGKYTPSVHQLWVGTKFSLEIGLGLPNSDSSVLWFSKGIYVLSHPTINQDSEKKTVSFNLVDKFANLESGPGRMQTGYTIPVGTEIKSIINDILSQDIGNGYVLDPCPMIYHSSFEGKLTPQTISGEIGDTWGSVILKLATMLSAEVFYNAMGNLTFVPIVETINDEDKSTIFNFFSMDGDFQTSSYDLDFDNIVNKIVVVGANINNVSVRAEAENQNPESPISINRIGRRVGSVIQDSNITSRLLAQERADFELRKSMLVQTSISNAIYFNPLLSVNNVITLTDDGVGIKKERMVLQSVSFSLNYDGIMNIASTNIHNLIFV